MFSETWRRIFYNYYGVTVGEFSYGPGLQPGLFSSGTTVGAYCSIASGVQVLRRNHPADWVSQHPLFFNRVVGLLNRDAIHSLAENPIQIGNDVWLGLNAIICPGCRSIGDGAIAAAGAVVTKDVPAFTIVGGNPARPIRKRFAPEVEEAVAASQWWLHPFPEIVENLDLFTQELTPELLPRFKRAFPTSAEPSPTTRIS